MARISPQDFDVVENHHRFSGELATLLALKEELSDQYCVFHGVHWTKVEDDAAVYGEIDFLSFYCILKKTEPKDGEIFYDL